MGLGDVFDDGQTQARSPGQAAAAVVDPVDTLKEAGQVLRFNATALVPDSNNHFGAGTFSLHLDLTVRLAIFNGVVHQVHHGLLQQGRIGSGPEIIGAVQVYGNTPGFCLGLTNLDGRFQHTLDLLGGQKNLPSFGILFYPG